MAMDLDWTWTGPGPELDKMKKISDQTITEIQVCTL